MLTLLVGRLNYGSALIHEHRRQLRVLALKHYSLRCYLNLMRVEFAEDLKDVVEVGRAFLQENLEAYIVLLFEY